VKKLSDQIDLLIYGIWVIELTALG